MRWISLVLALSLLSSAAAAGDLQYKLEGGDHLTVAAVADKQTWKIVSGQNGPIALVAAVIGDRLILEEFSWPRQPQPGPGPGPNPNPDPQPPSGPKTVLWIEESSQRTPQQALAIANRSLREAIVAGGWTLRVVDIDVVDENGQPPSDLAPYLMAAKQAGLPRVFIFQDGREVYAGAAPPDVSSFANLLRRYGLPVGASGEDAGVPIGTSSPGEQKETSKGAASCPTGRCPAQTPSTRRWRLFR